MRDVVIAGNYHQFISWCKENELNPRDFVYLSDPCKSKGLKGSNLIKVGTWWERKDIDLREVEFDIMD